MSDIIGQALRDYFEGNYTEDLQTETNISEADELPLPYLFRDFDTMPRIEQQALLQSTGRILDVGCGAGSHSLWLQSQGKEVMAIDTSEGAAWVASQRGVDNVKQIALLEVKDTLFDTILLLMNGTGIFGTYKNAGKYLKHLKSLLAPNGHILIDSSDLQYMYDTDEDGAIWVPGDRYYGELDFTVTYKGKVSKSFPWLYLDPQRLEELANKNGLQFEIVTHGDHYDYLARLTHL